jgi:diguanylate cyclase (GGDEF)-like protein
MELDFKTLVFINDAVLFLSAVTAWYFWRQYRDNLWLLCWSLATAVCGVAVLLVGLYGPVPPIPLGAPVAVMLLAGYGLSWESMRLFNDRRPRPVLLASVLLIFAALLAGSLALGATLSQRANLLWGFLGLFAILAAYEVARKAKEKPRRTRLVMAGLFGMMAAVMIVRTAMPWLQPAASSDDIFHDPLRGAATLVNSIAVTGLSIALMMMAHERTTGRHRRLALTDDLTGLPNRRHFLMEAERLLHRSKDRPVCVLIMDLDHFSAVNERFGHAGGDEALASFAALLRQQLPRNDLVARYGGEEFCALLMDADQAGALAVAERIREALAARPVMIQGEPHAVTVSIGVAQLRDGDFDGTLQQADKALYRAKAEGRNRSAAGQGQSKPDLGMAAG